MFTFLTTITLFTSIASASNDVDSWLHGSDELTPHGRLQVALSAVESNADESKILELGKTHPHIAVMVTDKDTSMVLDYILTLPSPERHKLRKGDGIIRKFDAMEKSEKKQALLIAKTLGLPKKLEAIRIGSFNGIDITMEIAYKEQGTTQRTALTLAKPFTPEVAQSARVSIEKALGSKPLPPTEGPYSLMPFGNPSFELRLTDWDEGIGFQFENEEPIGAISLDSDNKMDGAKALRFYNTEDTMVFHNLQQKVPVESAYKIRFQGFVQAKNAEIEYRQTPERTNIELQYIDASSEVIKTETLPIRLGSYDWEALVVDSYVPQDAQYVNVVLGSSVSGTIWVDGLSMIRIE